MPPLFLDKSKRVPLHLIKQDFVKLSDENRRLTFHVSIPLDDGNNLMGMPDWVQNFFTVMVKVANKGKKQVFDNVVPNCFVEMFATEKTKTKLFSIVNEATLSGFSMERTGKDDEDVAVKLSFKISFAARKEIYDWAYDTKKTTFWAAFEESQQELYREPDSEDGDSDDDDEDEDEDDEKQPTQTKLPVEEDELSGQDRRKREREAVSKAKGKLAIM